MDMFEACTIGTGESTIFLRRGGQGPAVLLLHGFPQTHLMWRDVAPPLAQRFTVIAADLRGYGHSGCPASTPDHGPYAKRAMASELVDVMGRLGFARFAVAGHDRGGRVAYRMALDHPDRITKLAVLDILPTETVWARADDRLALAFWPWSLLAQDAPLPEKLIAGAPEAIVDAALNGWGSAPQAFSAVVRAAYVTALSEPAHIHAICEEYRAAAEIDREHDRQDAEAGRRIACPVLALWSAGGPLDTWYEQAGGTLALWRAWADHVEGEAVPGGHFFPEEAPGFTAERLGRFLTAS